ncbi:hypothetical protein MTO98_26065 [Mucilaginibacter sp. SMC90]|uniref:hypothetical protein n=1 Tax=Mucilaginibacter sp. SMC90 TaxID=2929803 RepID=UPI001FB3437F|nr:hypothetical protein [Mucilaginibacter sp. SMC90]UOE47880.1 hypothetical protein MTO98_26065 [Mucilaginibacter sp. SMC90]
MRTNNNFHIVVLAACFFFSACFNPKKYDEVKPQGIIEVTSGDSTVVADGATAYVVSAKVTDTRADKKKMEVIFKTSLGTFAGGTDSIKVTADDHAVSSAKLFSLKAGVAIITATVQKITAIKKPTVTFTATLADNLTVSVDSISVRNNNKSEVVITASLKTTGGGKASVGTPVSFQVTDVAGNAIGMFFNDINTGKSDANGQVQVHYVPLNTSYTGYLTATAQTTSNSGALITGSTRFFLSK